MNIYGEYFYGNKISDYGLKYGFVDYGTLAKAFDAVLNNTIFGVGWEIGEWEQLSGYIDNTAELEELQEQIDELQELEELTEEQENKLQELQDNYTDLEYEQDETPEVYQFYIVDACGADLVRVFRFRSAGLFLFPVPDVLQVSRILCAVPVCICSGSFAAIVLLY